MLFLPYTTLITFFLTALLLCLSPGPDNIFVLTQSALYGKRAGLWVTLGLCTGLIGHTLAVALGVAAIFAASSLAFTLLKFIGAAYLIYLAWQAWHAPNATLVGSTNKTLSNTQLYIRGIVMNISNPKVSIFFLAFLPQFAKEAYGALAPQMLILGGVFILATLFIFGSIALLASNLGHMLRKHPKAQTYLNKTTAFILFALAIKLSSAQANA